MTTTVLLAKGIIPYDINFLRPHHTESTSSVITETRGPISSEVSFSEDTVVRLLIAKGNRRASEDETDMIERVSTRVAAREQTWARIGLTIVLGLIIFLIGCTLRYIVSGSLPHGIAGLGILLMVSALGYGGLIQKQSEFPYTPLSRDAA